MPAPALATKVGDVMTTQVFAVATDTSLETAARLLTQHHIGGAPVIDEAGHPLGVVSQSDLVDPDRGHTGKVGRPRYFCINDERVASVTAEHSTLAGIVADVMSPFVVGVGPETPLDEAARMMLADNVHRLLVVRGGRLVGVLSTMDVLKAMAR